jgi:hypothetical protein
MSSVAMSMKSFHCRWAIMDGCLVVFRWMSMGGIKLFLMFPPMSLTGDAKKERDVMITLAQSGIGCRLSEEDLVFYGDLKARPYPVGDEFVYRTSDYTSGTMVGQDWHRWRKVRNAMEKSGWKTRNWLAWMTPPSVLEQIKEISGIWATAGEPKSLNATRALLGMTTDHIPGLFLYVHYDAADRPVAWGAYHRISTAWACILAWQRIPEIDFPGSDSSIFDHLGLVAMLRPAVTFNTASGTNHGDTRLIQAKRKLRPCKELKLYTIETGHQITKGDWVASRRFT